MGQVSPSATKEADSSALWSNCELKSSLCGAERIMCPLSSGLKMNLVFKREDKGWGWVYWEDISMALVRWRLLWRNDRKKESSQQRPAIYLDFYSLNKKINSFSQSTQKSTIMYFNSREGFTETGGAQDHEPSHFFLQRSQIPVGLPVVNSTNWFLSLF